MLRETDRKIKKLLNERKAITEECYGCGRIEPETVLCSAAVDPKAKWRMGFCNLATHATFKLDKEKEKVRVGQQKSKKKSRR